MSRLAPGLDTRRVRDQGEPEPEIWDPNDEDATLLQPSHVDDDDETPAETKYRNGAELFEAVRATCTWPARWSATWESAKLGATPSQSRVLTGSFRIFSSILKRNFAWLQRFSAFKNQQGARSAVEFTYIVTRFIVEKSEQLRAGIDEPYRSKLIEAVAAHYGNQIADPSTLRTHLKTERAHIFRIVSSGGAIDTAEETVREALASRLPFAKKSILRFLDELLASPGEFPEISLAGLARALEWGESGWDDPWDGLRKRTQRHFDVAGKNIRFSRHNNRVRARPIVRAPVKPVQAVCKSRKISKGRKSAGKKP